MALNNFTDLNAMHMDVLREIGNIGSGNSATSLSQILSSEIDIGVPVVRDLEYNEVTLNVFWFVPQKVSNY